MTEPHEADDNPDILEIIKERMVVGVERYGHGLRTEDDTRQWGNQDDSWVEMGIEEALDLTVYLATALLRIKKERRALTAEVDALRRERNQMLTTVKGAGSAAEKRRSFWKRLWEGDR